MNSIIFIINHYRMKRGVCCTVGTFIQSRVRRSNAGKKQQQQQHESRIRALAFYIFSTGMIIAYFDMNRKRH